MIRGLYSAAAGMITQYKKMDVLGNNVTNVDTTGFKQDDISLSAFGMELLKRTDTGTEVGELPLCVSLDSETTDITGGTLKSTGIDTDLAVEGSGFFAVQSQDGEVKYTRAGDFTVDTGGYLALPSGERLLDAGGNELYVGGDSFTVSADGTVTLPDGTTDTVALYEASDDAQAGTGVQKRRDGFFDIQNAQQADGTIRQGWLEDSNTDVIDNMTGLMESTRSFQGSQQAFEISIQTLDKLVSEVGSLK